MESNQTFKDYGMWITIRPIEVFMSFKFMTINCSLQAGNSILPITLHCFISFHIRDSTLEISSYNIIIAIWC